MKYHINYDGKILPCRARVKACPYNENRHADNYEDLYYRYQDDFNSVNPPQQISDKLKKGDPLRGVSDFDNEIATSNSPMELICSTYKQAIKYAGAASLSNKEQHTWEWATDLVTKQYSAGYDAPKGIPQSICDEAKKRFSSNSRNWSIFGSHRRHIEADGNWRRLIDATPQLKELDNKRKSGYQMSPEVKQEYVNSIREDFDVYANLLNTRKLLSQPMIISNDPDKLVNNMDQLSDDELLSIYDDSTISDKEIQKKLNEVNNFEFTPIDQLSDAANNNLANWMQRARQAKDRYIVGSAQRTLLALTSAQVLFNRDKNYGDLIYTVNEDNDNN